MLSCLLHTILNIVCDCIRGSITISNGNISIISYTDRTFFRSFFVVCTWENVCIGCFKVSQYLIFFRLTQICRIINCDSRTAYRRLTLIKSVNTNSHSGHCFLSGSIISTILNVIVPRSHRFPTIVPTNRTINLGCPLLLFINIGCIESCFRILFKSRKVDLSREIFSL